jgi:hypothetical protein
MDPLAAAFSPQQLSFIGMTCASSIDDQFQRSSLRA